MLIHPYDDATSEFEWREWIAQSAKFGVLAVPSIDGKAPVMVPTHFTLLGSEILIHLQRTNTALPLLETGSEVSLSIVGDYAYIESQWRARDAAKPEEGVPTSYYVAVNFALRPTVINHAEGIAEILNIQMDDLQPAGGHSPIVANQDPYGQLMNSIRGVRLEILSVEAKFKFDDHKTIEFRENISRRLLDRNLHLDSSAAAQQRRRLEIIGDFSEFRQR